MNNNFSGRIMALAIVTMIASAVLGIGTLGFIVWVVVKLMQHFGVI